MNTVMITIQTSIANPAKVARSNEDTITTIEGSVTVKIKLGQADCRRRVSQSNFGSCGCAGGYQRARQWKDPRAK